MSQRQHEQPHQRLGYSNRDRAGFINDLEAARWVTNARPFYMYDGGAARWWPYGTNVMAQANGTFTTNIPIPQIRVVGGDGRMVNINVCNGTGTNKTDFHLVSGRQRHTTLASPTRGASTANDQIGQSSRARAALPTG